MYQLAGNLKQLKRLATIQSELEILVDNVHMLGSYNKKLMSLILHSTVPSYTLTSCLIVNHQQIPYFSNGI